MNGPEILELLRQQLTLEVQSYTSPGPNPLSVSSWVAMSMLQKSIRRGHRQFALQAAATLLRDKPEKFWRRCAVIAFEDVGVADLDLIGLVVGSLAGKAFRSKIAGEWAVASYLVERLCAANKCRAADDLLMVAERHPTHERSRLGLTYFTVQELLHIVDRSSSLPTQALALWYGVGTDRCPSPQLRTRRGAPQTIFDELCEAGYPHTVVEIGREGFRRTSQVLCPLVVLLSAMKPSEPLDARDDDFPPETMCGPLPSWSLDMYSREGQRALVHFLKRDCQTARWVRKHIPTSERKKFLGNVLFAAEGGCMRARMRWAVGDELRRLAEIECQGVHCPDASDIIALLQNDLPLLNAERGHVL